MSNFDSVWTKCPVCSQEVEFQSKAGSCELHSYRTSSVPEVIALDLDSVASTCSNCKTHLILHHNECPRNIRMTVSILDTEKANF